jgi:hypothetical protein
MVWDMPTEVGRYAFGIELADWRFGRNMSRVQRLFSVEVDSIYSSSKEANRLAPEFVTYPNPARGELNLHIKDAFQLGNSYNLMVEDVLGRHWFERPIGIEAFGSGLSLDVSGFPTGIYLVTVESLAGRLTKKVLIE